MRGADGLPGSVFSTEGLDGLHDKNM